MTQDDAPVMVWFTGGPGGSSQASALVENGDCRYDSAGGKPQSNPHGWTEAFHMVYLDQPADVGFSYIDDAGNTSSYPKTTEEAALDVVTFLRLFAEAFPSLADRPIHLAGESFGGRYIPVFGGYVLQYNELVGPMEQIPLASLVAISAWTHPSTQLPSLYDVACYPFKQYSSSLHSSACEVMAGVIQTCETMLTACEITNDSFVCAKAGEYCEEHINKVVGSQHINKLDRRMTCKVPGACYPVMMQMQAYMNHKDVFDGLLEVTEQSGGLKENWEFISPVISETFRESGVST